MVLNKGEEVIILKPMVAIVGRPNVGKSTLFNRLTGGRTAIIEDTPGVPRDRLYKDAEWQGKIFTVIDTGGLEINSDDIMLEKIKQQVQIAIEEADIILFVVDGKTGITLDDQEVANMLRKTNKECSLWSIKLIIFKTLLFTWSFIN